jgi:hypothetical protein
VSLLPWSPTGRLRVLAQVLLISLPDALVDRGQPWARCRWARRGRSRRLRQGDPRALPPDGTRQLPRRPRRLARLVRPRLSARVRRPATRRDGRARAAVLATMTMDALKACRKCGQPAPLSAFPLNARTLDGRSSWCRPCHREAARLHHLKSYVPHPRAPSPIRGVALARLRRCGRSWLVSCSKCGAFLPRYEFGTLGDRPGLRPWCGECTRAMATGYNRAAGHLPRWPLTRYAPRWGTKG